jgi:tripartite-type tricarboxylate transporter receptor subunit TctC
MIARMRIKTALASFAMLAAAFAASAQEFPVKPITLIVPWPAGGPTDVGVRAMAEIAAKHLGQPIIVENKAGGTGTVGPATMAAIAKPDGYTIAQMPITVYRLPMMQNTTWTADDFTYIIHLTGYTFAAMAHADTPFKTWQDVLDYAKKNPGKITYATSGAGSSLHLGMEMMAERSGVKFTHVPFKGAAEVNAAVAGGHTMMAAGGLSVKPMVDAGKVRLLNVWTEKRLKSVPDLPTLKELGYPWVFDSPWGIAGPKGMDPKVVAKIHDAFKKAIEDEGVVTTLERYEMVPNYKNSADYKAAVAEQVKMEEELLKRIGMYKKQ